MTDKATITREELYAKYPEDTSTNIDAILKEVLGIAMSQKTIALGITSHLEFCQNFIREQKPESLDLVKTAYQGYLSEISDQIPEPTATAQADRDLADAVSSWSNATTDAAIDDMQTVAQQFRSVVVAGATTKLVGDFSAKLSRVGPPSVDSQNLDPNDSLTKLQVLFAPKTQSALPEAEES